jgi:hypothetical protein
VSNRWIDSWDEDDSGVPIPAQLPGGVVQCHEFPLVVMTSNGEREFPPAFNRRCLRVAMPDFSRDEASLRRILEGQWGGVELKRLEVALSRFQAASGKARDQDDNLALDQLLNLAHLLEQDGPPAEATLGLLEAVLLQALNSEPTPAPDPPSQAGGKPANRTTDAGAGRT